MDTETRASNSGEKSILIIISVIVGVFIVYYSIMSMLGPVKKITDLKEKYGVKQTGDKKIDERLFLDSAYIRMLREKSFLQAKITMAENDSISLSLNLTDSTANLEINGVRVHSARMTGINMSKILQKGEPYIISSMFSAPLNIVSDMATIKKEPLMIKMAPKDTSEFKPDIIPDTTDYEPVDYILETDTGLRLFVCQEEEDKASDRRRLFWFDLNYRFKNAIRSLKYVVTFKVPEYNPFIKISLPKADAKIIYRAIPRKGQIAIYI